MIQTTKRGKLFERILVGLALAVIIGTTAGGVSGMIAEDSKPEISQESQ